MSNQDKIKQALERIDQGLATINSDEDWLKFLFFQSQFYQYSFQNAILIYLQSGGNASYVKGYKAWNKLDRHVKKGAKGLAIIAPCFRKTEVFKEPANANEYHDAEGEKETKKVISGFKITHVFDIADTEGSDEHIPVLVKGLSGNSLEEKKIYEALLFIISEDFVIKDITGTVSKGSFNRETKVISIRSDMDYLQRIKTLIHETAHGYDFEMNPADDIPRNRREIIAESVAFCVSARLGLDVSSYSMSYIQSWLKEKSELKLIADTVQRISYKIIIKLAESSDSAFSDLREESEEQ